MRITIILTNFLIAFSCPVLLIADETPANLLPPDRPMHDAIDHYIDAKLKKAKIQPAGQANPSTYVRRLTLDLIGRIPTEAEVDDFVSNSDSTKKAKLVDRLMADGEFVRHWADRFAVMLRGQGNNRRNQNSALEDYLRRSLAANRPWDRIFRELMLPDQNDKDQRGANEFLKTRIRDIDRTTVDVSTLFFGVNISCAQCHEHPHVEQWTQDHFYGMKSFFARTFDNGGFLAERSFGEIKFTPNKGKPKTAKVMFLTGKSVSLPKADKKEQAQENKLFKQLKKQKKPAPLPKFSLRSKFVDLALEPAGRKYFSRSIANRIWHQLLGYGLVMPLDQMHEANRPSHPELLQWLARDTVDHNYDLRRLIRGIVLSDTYARSSRRMGKDLIPDKLFAQGQIRALAPMQLARSLLLASGDPESLPKKKEDLQKHLEQLEGRARGLASMFPEPKDRFQVSVKEAMLFSNNERIQNDLLQGGNNLATRLAKIKDLPIRAEYAVQAVFGRPATDTEKQALADYMRSRVSRTDDACRQVVWALLTSSEFRFNH